MEGSRKRMPPPPELEYDVPEHFLVDSCSSDSSDEEAGHQSRKADARRGSRVRCCQKTQTHAPVWADHPDEDKPLRTI